MVSRNTHYQTDAGFQDAGCLVLKSLKMTFSVILRPGGELYHAHLCFCDVQFLLAPEGGSPPHLSISAGRYIPELQHSLLHLCTPLLWLSVSLELPHDEAVRRGVGE